MTPVEGRAQGDTSSFWGTVSAALETYRGSERRRVKKERDEDQMMTVAWFVLEDLLYEIPSGLTWQGALTVALSPALRANGARPTMLATVSALASTCKSLRATERYCEYMAAEAPHRIAAAEREAAREIARQEAAQHAEDEARRVARVAHAYQVNVQQFRERLARKMDTQLEEVDWLLDGPVGGAIGRLLPVCPIGEGGIAHASGVGTWVGMQIYREHSVPEGVVPPTNAELARAERALRGDLLATPREAVERLIAAMYHIACVRPTFEFVREQFEYVPTSTRRAAGKRNRGR